MPLSHISNLSDLNVQERRQALDACLRSGADTRTAAVALVMAVGDEDEQVREAAVGALESLEAPLEQDIPRLAKLLADSAKHADVAYWAATLLGRANEAAAEAVPALAAALRDTWPMAVRQRAAWALGRMGPAARAAESELQAAAASDDPRLARLAAEALTAVALS